MQIRLLFDPVSCTCTYLILDADTRKAVIVDPVFRQAQRDIKLIQELGLTLLYSLETHVHADHITAASHLKKITHCQIVYPQTANIDIADRELADGEILSFNDVTIKTIHTPGHTTCSTCYLINDTFLLSGDTLLIRSCGRTDFQQGDAATLFDSITRKLFILNDSTIVYPGHSYKGMFVSTIGEEKRCNPRTSRNKMTFVKTMTALDLPQPEMMEIAIPANLRCGQINLLPLP